MFLLVCDGVLMDLPAEIGPRPQAKEADQQPSLEVDGIVIWGKRRLGCYVTSEIRKQR